MQNEETKGGTVKVAPTREQFEAYLGAFEFFNVELFGGTLPEPVLNFSRGRSRRTAGFFAPSRWNRSDQLGADSPRAHEISLNPDHLNADDVRTTLSTLVHEMVHLWQEVFGKVPRRNYHDRQWGDKMTSIGLVPSRTGLPGGKSTGPSMFHYVQEGGPFAHAFAKMPDALHLPWRTGRHPGKKDTTPAPKKVDPSKLKYTCAGCGANVWGKLGLRIQCGQCEQPFVSE